MDFLVLEAEVDNSVDEGSFIYPDDDNSSFTEDVLNISESGKNSQCFKICAWESNTWFRWC